MPKKLITIAIIIFVIVLGYLKFFANQTGENKGFNPEQYTNFVFSRHAKCRMNCRSIDEAEIRDIVHNGTVNNAKSRLGKKGKTFALEGWSKDNQHIRVVCAPKNKTLTIVTVIDLGTEWPCNCK